MPVTSGKFTPPRIHDDVTGVTKASRNIRRHHFGPKDLLCVDETDAARTDVDVVTARERVVTVLEANTSVTRTVTWRADDVTSLQVRLVAADVALLVRVQCA